MKHASYYATDISEADAMELAVEQVILDLLHSHGPCTLGQIVAEVLRQSSTPRRTVLTAVMTAIVNLQEVFLICDYDQDIDDPISDHAWDIV